MPEPTVAYIAGWGRSGTTVLGRIMSASATAVFVGEAVFVWRGIAQGRLCGCGERLAVCPFWRGVGDVAFDGWDRAPIDLMLSDGPNVARHRRWARYRSDRLDPPVREALARLYRAMGTVADGRLLVDSSKTWPYAKLLAASGVDLQLIHVIRDARGVAHSWGTPKPDPDNPRRMMPREPVMKSAVYWLIENELLRRMNPTMTLRYEDLVADPARALGAIDRAFDLGLPAGLAAELAGDGAALGPSHSVSGNPDRFDPAPVTLVRDDRWRRSMSGPRKALVTATTLPGLVANGYVPSRPRGAA